MLLEQQARGYPVTPVTGATLDWYWWRYLIKADGTVVDLLGHTWNDVPSCDGVYFLTLTAADLDQRGLLEVYIHDAVSLGRPILQRFWVVDKNAWDARYAEKLAAVDSQHAQRG